MGVIINAHENKNPIGISGRFPPYAVLWDSLVRNVEDWSDGTTDTDGILYPVNFDSTTQTEINNNMTAMRAIAPSDDLVVAASGKKRKVAGNFCNGYNSIDTVTVMRGNLTEVTASALGSYPGTTRPNISKFGNDFVLTRIDAGNAKIRIMTVNDDNSITLGTEATIGTATEVRQRQLDASNIVVVFHASGTLKSVVVAVSGTTCTPGTIHTTAITNVSELFDIDVITTNKIIIGYSVTGTSYPQAVAATISAGAFTYGTNVQINATAASAITGKFTVLKSSTDKAFIVFTQTNVKVASVSTSGTTVTVGNVTAGTAYSSYDINIVNTVLVIANTSGTGFNIYGYCWNAFARGNDPYTITLGSGSWIYPCIIPTTNGANIYTGSQISSLTTPRIQTISTDPFTGAIYGMDTQPTFGKTVPDGQYQSYVYADWCVSSDASTLFALQTGNYKLYGRSRVDIGINSTDIITNGELPFMNTYGIRTPAKGRKVYIDVENKESVSRNFQILHCTANVE